MNQILLKTILKHYSLPHPLNQRTMNIIKPFLKKYNDMGFIIMNNNYSL